MRGPPVRVKVLACMRARQMRVITEARGGRAWIVAPRRPVVSGAGSDEPDQRVA